MRSFGPKALLKLNGETVIARQVRLIRSLCPQATFTVVGGFEVERLRRGLPRDATLAYNPAFETTNVARSLAIGLKSIPAGPVLVVLGDLVFNEDAIEETIENAIAISHSYAIIDSRKQERVSEVGVNVVDGCVTHFSYGLPQKWAQIVLLAPRERLLFERAAAEPGRDRHYAFEILNEVLDLGGQFRAVIPPGLQLVEIDSSKDIPSALLIP
jgi:choline kinase